MLAYAPAARRTPLARLLLPFVLLFFFFFELPLQNADISSGRQFCAAASKAICPCYGCTTRVGEEQEKGNVEIEKKKKKRKALPVSIVFSSRRKSGGSRYELFTKDEVHWYVAISDVSRRLLERRRKHVLLEKNIS